MSTGIESHLYLIIARVTILFLGAAIVFISYRAYRRMRSAMMLLVSIGFSFITLAPLVEGVLFEFYGFGLPEAHVVETLISLAGLGTLIYAFTKTGS